MSEASSPYSDLTGLAGPTASVPVRGGVLGRPVVAQATVEPLGKKEQAIAQRAVARGMP